MRFITHIPILLAASATLATASPKCAAQKVLDQCLQTEKFALENCSSSDWDCLCTQSTNVVNCYNNCPEDDDRTGAQTTREQNCANAKAYDPPTTAPTGTGTWTSIWTPPPTSASSVSASATSEATGTSSSDSSSDSDGSSSSDSSEPTKALSGLQAKTSPSQGAAAGVAAGAVGWLGVLGLGLGVML